MKITNSDHKKVSLLNERKIIIYKRTIYEESLQLHVSLKMQQKTYESS